MKFENAWGQFIFDWLIACVLIHTGIFMPFYFLILTLQSKITADTKRREEEEEAITSYHQFLMGSFLQASIWHVHYATLQVVLLMTLLFRPELLIQWCFLVFGLLCMPPICAKPILFHIQILWKSSV